MKTFDRIILTLIALSLAALALNPYLVTAHEDNSHSCSGTGYGELEGSSEVYIYSLDIECTHY